jgi:hypothetical protein
MSQRARGRPWLGLTLLILSSTAMATASAPTASVVSIGEVVVALDGTGPEGGPELRQALRSALLEELAEMTLKGVSIRRPLVVSLTLTKLSSERRAEHAKATAAISLALRRADDQVLFAELRGRASAEEAAGNLASVRSAALRGAVRGAVGRLPEAVQRTR